MDELLKMLDAGVFISNHTIKDGVITYQGEEVETSVVTVKTNEIGDTVEFIFHRGCGFLIDMNVKHVCTCHKH